MYKMCKKDNTANSLLFLIVYLILFHKHDFFPPKSKTGLVIFYEVNKCAILAEIYNFRKLLKVLTQGFLTVEAIGNYILENSSTQFFSALKELLTWQHY